MYGVRGVKNQSHTHTHTHTQSIINTVKIQVPTLQLAGESVSEVQQIFQ
jgi:hypothetical protein